MKGENTPQRRKIPSYPLRMPQCVRDWYEKESKQNGRSLNQELVKVLEERMNRSIGARKNANR